MFSYIVFDLDTRRIVDFRLKPWADRFLTLRSAILDPNASTETADLGSITGLEPVSRDMHPGGYQPISCDSLFRVVERVLVAFYQNRPLPQKPASSLIPEKQSRNLEIVQRFLAGERAADLAWEFGISVRRVNRLVRRYSERGNP